MPKVALVTGSNKGIGFAIVRSLCKKLHDSDVVYLTSRDVNRGKEAIKQLQKEGLNPHFHQLDISDDQSVQKLLDHLLKTHGGLDILVNNAGILINDPGISIAEKVQRTLKTNFFDTLKSYNILSPAIRPHGRVVFVSSGWGPIVYKRLSPALQKSFTEAKTEDDVQTLIKKFESDVIAGTHVQEGWPEDNDGKPSYGVSKLGIIIATKVFGEQISKDTRKDILINSCSPGYVATDMNQQKGDRTIDEGAVTSVSLALLPPNSKHPQGQYFDPDMKLDTFLME